MLTGLSAVLSADRPRFAYNLTSVEGFRAIVEWGEAHRMPMIMQCSERYLRDLGDTYFENVVVPRLARSEVPFVLHLDHATSLKAVQTGIQLGFSSVMFDGSGLPLKPNIQASSDALGLCRQARIASFEAEIGHVGGAEDGDDEETRYLTRVEEAQQFIAEVPVDFLAVSVGNAHGQYRMPPKLRWDLLDALHHVIPVPLVLHGGTGILPADFRRATKLGVQKINLGTELKVAWARGLVLAMESGEREPDRIRSAAKRSIAETLDRTERILFDV